MSQTDVTAEKQRPAHLFKPGQSGNPAGRPKSARSKLSEAFLQDVHATWEEHGVRALQHCATKKPVEFCRLVGLLMPKDISMSISHDASAFALTFRTALQMLGNEPPVRRRALPGEKVIDHDHTR